MKKPTIAIKLMEQQKKQYPAGTTYSKLSFLRKLENGMDTWQAPIAKAADTIKYVSKDEY